ncbi:UNVERIFIED_CONTAM: hypothetical protein FKN15_013728 [Acipenser sinensis]
MARIIASIDLNTRENGIKQEAMNNFSDVSETEYYASVHTGMLTESVELKPFMSLLTNLFGFDFANSGTILDEGQSPKHNQWQNRTVLEWSCKQVSHWLMGLNLEQYIPEFTAKNIDGEQLLQLDGSKLKSLGITTSQDRVFLKKKIKDLRVYVEKARKTREKLEKHREKLRKKEQEHLKKQAKAGKPLAGPTEGSTE